MSEIKYITEGNREVHLGDLRMCDMKIILMPYEIPMTEGEFENLPIYGFNSGAPCHNGLIRTKGLCRFQLPDKIEWHIGRPTSRRIMKCWKASFPPSFSYKEEAANAMVHAVSVHIPEMSGRFGTLVGAELLTCALNSVSTETLRAWLKYREEQGD